MANNPCFPGHRHKCSRFQKPFSPKEAREIVSQWLDQHWVNIVEPGERHWEILGRLMKDTQIRRTIGT